MLARFKPISGRVDQAGGLVFRYRDADNYYLVRANALEDNVRFYHVVDGRRTQVAGAAVDVSSGTWHELRVVSVGDREDVYFDGVRVVGAKDETFEQPGLVGVWTKADSVTAFDDLVVWEIRAGS